MQLRKAKACELDTIYEMGFDVWGSGLPFEEYLSLCRQSKKYQLGFWYVLIDKETVYAIVYRDGLAKTGCFGIGSLSTPPKLGKSCVKTSDVTKG